MLVVGSKTRESNFSSFSSNSQLKHQMSRETLWRLADTAIPRSIFPHTHTHSPEPHGNTATASTSVASMLQQNTVTTIYRLTDCVNVLIWVRLICWWIGVARNKLSARLVLVCQIAMVWNHLCTIQNIENPIPATHLEQNNTSRKKEHTHNHINTAHHLRETPTHNQRTVRRIGACAKAVRGTQLLHSQNRKWWECACLAKKAFVAKNCLSVIMESPGTRCMGPFIN